MKKNLFLLLTAITLTAFTSCSKDDDGGNGSLNGTSWEYTETQGIETVVVTMTFTSNKVTLTVKGYEHNVLQGSGTYTGPYTFDGEKGSITLTEGTDNDFDKGTVNFTVSGNKLTVKDDEGVNSVFTKK